MKESQPKRVLEVLKSGNPVCSDYFIYNMHPGIPRIAAVINRLKRDNDIVGFWSEMKYYYLLKQKSPISEALTVDKHV